MSPRCLKGGFIPRTCRTSAGGGGPPPSIRPSISVRSVSPSLPRAPPSTSGFYQGICGCVWME